MSIIQMCIVYNTFPNYIPTLSVWLIDSDMTQKLNLMLDKVLDNAAENSFDCNWITLITVSYTHLQGRIELGIHK